MTKANGSFPPNPQWYRDGVIYECHVRAFADGNGDGIGDFIGLTERLDYLQELGITAIWILPFYPSPGRDDGYDIADFRSVNPAYGDMASFRRFLREAHQRGIRVITELVLNHTSDQHPWFQRARTAPPGSKWRDFYVWSDDPTRYGETRIIFSDTEPSNWTWDAQAGAYYWHRFFHHQPDLNFDNPAVGDELLKVVDFWFDMGVDGLRLDAVPYLYEREGTNCENLPETHAFLRRLRAHVDANYADRMLLAEANQWPQDAASYFGTGDECHMNFHFPLMPRLFMSVQTEQRFPIIDILEQTPELPDGCQWATFLRNHDELTLEMVTDEERDFMYRVYAHDPQMRLNLGIRRRLAPLLDGDRRKIDLLTALLFSLPGTPVLYYGDELGMGDNVWLGDRDGVRTPMQWTADRNAGFSRANPQQLYLPLITDGRYHYEMVNVEAQQGSSTSQLRHTMQLIALRKRIRSLGRGNLEFLDPDNPHVLSFLRLLDGDAPFLMVANLSRLAQRVDLDVSRFEGFTLREVFGHSDFGVIGNEPRQLTLPPYGYFWFTLEAPHDRAETVADDAPPTLSGSWPRVVQQPTPDLIAALRRTCERARWFRGDAATLADVSVIANVPCGDATSLLVLETVSADGSTDQYNVPVTYLTTGEPLDERAVIAVLDSGSIVDALACELGVRDLAQVLSTRGRSRPRVPRLDSAPTAGLRPALGSNPAVQLARHEQSNSGAVIGNVVLKVIRHVDPGTSPEVELGELLAERDFAAASRLLGWADLDTGADSEPATTIVATEFIPHDTDAWQQARDEVSRFLERVPAEAAPAPLDWFAPPASAERLGAYAHSATRLGANTAALHTLLADWTGEQRAESWGELSRKALAQEFRTQVRRALRDLKRFRKAAPADLAERITAVLASEGALLDFIGQLRDQPLDGFRIRVHGDLHLGQILVSGSEYRFIDFEGEPLRTIGERRIKRTPLVDVAGMLRSFDYAAQMGLRELSERGLASDHLGSWADWWGREAGRQFLAGYLDTPAVQPLLPTDTAMRQVLLDCCLLAKSAYELRYEIEHRPDWVTAPLRAMERVVSGGRSSI